jgi:hypothetical protein
MLSVVRLGIRIRSYFVASNPSRDRKGAVRAYPLHRAAASATAPLQSRLR